MSDGKIFVKPIWRKPWFRKGYTEYEVVRETKHHFNAASTYSAYTTVVTDILFKTLKVEEAISFRDEMLKAGIM